MKTLKETVVGYLGKLYENPAYRAKIKALVKLKTLILGRTLLENGEEPTLMKVDVKVGLNGRTYNPLGMGATGKHTKLMYCADIGNTVKWGLHARLAVIMHLGLFVTASLRKTDKGNLRGIDKKLNYLLNGLDLLSADATTLTMDAEAVLTAAGELKETTEAGRTLFKGTEVLREVEHLINAYNDPETWGYTSSIVFDAKSQNWTLYALLFARDKDFLRKVNVGPGFGEETVDINTENGNIMLNLIGPEKLTRKGLDGVRELGKFISMLIAYSSGFDTAIAKAVKEAGAPEYENLLNEEIIRNFMNQVVPNFYGFADIVNSCSKRAREVDSFLLLGKPVILGETETKSRSVVLDTQGGMPTMGYESETVFVKESRRNFMLAFFTHNIDGWLVDFVAGSMRRLHGIHTDTNYDSFRAHPAYLFDTIEQYVLGLKYLASAYDGNLLEYMLEKIGVEDVETKITKFRETWEEYDVQDILDMDTAQFINHIWSV